MLENKTKLASHKRHLHEELTCIDCGLVVNGNKKLLDHRRHHKKASCTICHKEIIKRQLSKHMEWCRNGQKTKKKNLSCETCGYTASSSKRLESHIKTHEVKIIKMHTCGYCEYKSKRPDNVRRHEDSCKSKLRMEPPTNGPVSMRSLWISSVTCTPVLPISSRC